ncbi:MAG TPA: cohesin domain-containing protein, partial [Methylomirabilota bacterium]|nr:cohesin domain-containing protein [Methylomirabilota bacterium]
APCGPTAGGVLFTVNLAAVGGDGAGDITLTDVRIRDCANQPLPGQAGAPAQLVVSHSPPPAISDLASAQVTGGNGPGERTGITLTWTAPAPGPVALYRAPFGTYPEFDDGGGLAPDSTVAPGATWTLVSANAVPGLVDVPPARGSWHYVAFLTDSCGNTSSVSNMSRGSLDYHLGDVSDGAVRGQGDNRVALEDVSLLGAHYGISGATLVSDSVTYLDVGPTVNGLPTGRPATDDQINFEDLMVFATNVHVVSSPAASARPAKPGAYGNGEAFDLEAPTLVSTGDEIAATLGLSASGAMQGFSVQLAWDGGVLQPLAVAGAGLLEGQGGVVLSPGRGTVDGALLGRRGTGITGSGAVATFRFRVLRDGDPALRVSRVLARDPSNRPLDPERLT